MKPSDLYLPQELLPTSVPEGLSNTDLKLLRKFTADLIDQAVREYRYNLIDEDFGSLHNTSRKGGFMIKQKLQVVLVDDRLKEDRYKLSYATSGSAAFDVRACMNEPLHVSAGFTAKISLGFKMSLPEGTAALMIPRSGSGSQGLVLGNLVGLIDQDYTGEVFATIWNRSSECFRINPMDRIGQILIVPVIQVEPVIVESLTPTERGEGGFGSTGTA